ncbi:MAG: hypothetical protein Q7R98_01060 [Candidatus Jorgensenbacteria bacterium]|nr:hypothetical protein [Candidatus Jorgensenbacteria bacterium]
MLPKEAIIEYKKLFHRHYGIELSDTEAENRANNLVNLYQAVYQPANFGKIPDKKIENPDLPLN